MSSSKERVPADAEGSEYETQRRSIRYRPDPGTFAQIDLDTSHEVFNPTITALVTDESDLGCGLVSLSLKELEVGKHVRIKIGNLSPVQAEVRWKANLDHSVMKVGFMYLD